MFTTDGVTIRILGMNRVVDNIFPTILLAIAFSLILGVTNKKEDALPDLHTMASRMVMVGINFDDLYLNLDKYKKTFKEYPFGGIILYGSSGYILGDNGGKYTPNELMQLIVALKESLPPGVLIAVDQEGGKVQRLSARNGFTDYPSHYKLGVSQEVEDVLNISQDLASELAALGINLNFAPVVDLNYFKNPVIGRLRRSFSSDPEKVFYYAQAFIKGHHKAGVLSCIKHFPGHGSSRKDSHKGFTDVTNVYRERELFPFTHLAKQTDFVMTSHTYNRDFDNFWPASLSPSTIKKLRKQIGFNGVIITDDLLMGAIMTMRGRDGGKVTFQKIVEQAIFAGNDMLLFSDNFHSRVHYGEEAVDFIVEAVVSGDIEYEQIAQSYRLLVGLKAI